jgi:hypothetical protein
MLRYHKQGVQQVCCEQGCDQPRFCYGRCKNHFAHLDPTLYARLKGMTRAARQIEFERATSQPERPSWTYENPQGEAELMKKAERATGGAQ